jgi:hypothetical protein
MPAASSSPVDPVFCHLFAAADGLDGDRATESHGALPVTVIGIDELDPGGQLARLHRPRGQGDLHRVEDSFARFDGARRRIEIARDTLQAAADQIEQSCEMMWWLV